MDTRPTTFQNIMAFPDGATVYEEPQAAAMVCASHINTQSRNRLVVASLHHHNLRTEMGIRLRFRLSSNRLLKPNHKATAKHNPHQNPRSLPHPRRIRIYFTPTQQIEMAKPNQSRLPHKEVLRVAMALLLKWQRQEPT